MIVLRDSSAMPASCKGSVLALGNFDGLHLGHRAILQETVARARRNGKQAGVITFEPHPRRVFKPELPPLRIYPFAQKLRMLSELDIDFIRVVRFTRGFSETSAEDFVARILHQQMQVSHVVTGEDFIFGYKRAGNAAFLREKGKAFGFATTACSPVLHHGERCSSTRVRGLLAEGNMQEAAALLACPYSISGRVRQGDKRGRTLGFPTANIVPTQIFLPASGVYAVRSVIDGQPVKGAANIGSRPTFGGTEIRLETYLLDWDGDLYGHKLEIEFIDRIRSDVKFGSVDALVNQMEDDVVKARAIFKADSLNKTFSLQNPL